MKYLSLLILFFSLTNSLFSQNDVSIYSEGMASYYQQDFSSAIKLFEKLKLKKEVNEKLLSSSDFYIGESFLGLEQLNGAISVFENFLIKYPTSNLRELALFRLGNIYFEKKLHVNSRTKLIELVKNYPHSEYTGSAYHLIGETFIEENDLDSAEQFFNSAVGEKQNNNFVDYSIYSLANVYEKKGKYAEAVTYYDKLLGYHKQSNLAAQAQLRIGICYFQLGEYDNAVLELSDPLIEILDLDEQNEAEYILANTFYQLKEYNNAREAYRRILRNSPTSEILDRIRYGLAWIHFQQQNYLDAYKMFNVL